MSEKSKSKINFIEFISKNSWYIAFFSVLVGIVVFAILNNFGLIIFSIRIGDWSVDVSGRFLATLFFNPFWIIATFFFHQARHKRLREAEGKISNIDALMVDSINKGDDSILLKSLATLLSDNVNNSDYVQDKIREKELKEQIDKSEKMQERETNLKP